VQSASLINQTLSWPQLLLPWRIAAQLHRCRDLIVQFTKRDVLQRYRGSYLGIFWSLLKPLAMLAVYTVVFGYIFQSKLGNRPSETKLDFTLALFCGLAVFEFFAECINRAPYLVVSNPNYVTKVVFPLEILPVATVGAAFTHLLISLALLLAGQCLAHGSIPLTALYLPLIFLPLVLVTLGLCWFLASLGVFIRDMTAIVPVLLVIVMYASAIFYSISKVPPHLLPIILYNPVATVIEQARNAVLWGVPPLWGRYAAVLAASVVIMIAGYAFFMRTKSAFADVL
jgi:lipopolysaccharide transport system permease protein